ncbi:lipase family protein [Cohnella luojiensis]|uniref:Lipase family protein n=1 Tax=Cohnella luojiensis TaxID=652876 RepID=A0A4Y8LQL3_9BACL|nr:lipase family protein [Cohnella luojiensis]TFE23546.1 lipase family protein [Cohnella luojiensis]
MSGFDNRTAIFLASACSQTYAHYNDPNEKFVIPATYELVTDFHAKSLTGISEKFGFIIQSNTHAIVAFRGTSSTTDGVSDARASQTRFKCMRNAGQTHRGFSDIYYSARESILDALEKLSTNKAVYITGHSLGGALATLCALDVVNNSAFRPPVVYTFGSPRVGDYQFAKSYESKIDESYRVHNRFDVVTHLPPQTFKLPKDDKTYDYEHVRTSEALAFHNGSILANHAIGSYYSVLAKRDPLFAEELNRGSPGFCPDYARSEGRIITLRSRS